ncbi:hypothetical protein [Mangrovimonas xylaniphaga]|uniref:hypothetical protein n=1 Tax=Mangrovimonas xylaniphaga TaxID=1645915 RepID=UPI0006B48E93|nr:hypothetical protein [Mangrovimonas xylaniphaga]
MNKIIWVLLGILLTTATSCEFSENIYIYENGSGKMEFTFDASEMMKMTGDELTKESEEKVDSTFTFKELLEERKDSISKLSKEQQEVLKGLENYSMHMLMDPSSKTMKFDLFTNFKDVDELQDMFAAMTKMQAMGDEKGAGGNNKFSSLEQETSELKYSYNGRKFTRKSKIINQELHQQMVDSLSEMAMVYESSTYKLNYHFPRPIKSVSNEAALFSDDRKTVTVEFRFMEYLKNPEALNLEVILEK